jgi:hypothetical protein
MALLATSQFAKSLMLDWCCYPTPVYSLDVMASEAKSCSRSGFHTIIMVSKYIGYDPGVFFPDSHVKNRFPGTLAV